MAQLVLLAQEAKEDAKDPLALLVFEALTVWLVLLVHLVLLAKLAHLASPEAQVPKVTWVALDQKVAKVFKVHEVRQANLVFPVKLVHQVPLEKMD